MTASRRSPDRSRSCPMAARPCGSTDAPTGRPRRSRPRHLRHPQVRARWLAPAGGLAPARHRPPTRCLPWPDGTRLLPPGCPGPPSRSPAARAMPPPMRGSARAHPCVAPRVRAGSPRASVPLTSPVPLPAGTCRRAAVAAWAEGCPLRAWAAAGRLDVRAQAREPATARWKVLAEHRRAACPRASTPRAPGQQVRAAGHRPAAPATFRSEAGKP